MSISANETKEEKEVLEATLRCSELNKLQSNKDRIVAVDLVRILAAFVVMYEHLISDDLYYFLQFRRTLFHVVSSIFFVLAGYFVCRKITWKKALNNAWWCFAPFILWNTLTIMLAYIGGATQLCEQSIFSLYGFSDNGATSAGKPYDVPLWFMRDLVFLFLLSPIIFKFSKYILLVVIILTICPSTTDYTNYHIAFLSVRSVAYFACGCYLQSLSKDFQRKILSNFSPSFLTVYLLIITAVFILTHVYHLLPVESNYNFFYSILSLAFLYQLARLLEVKLPKAKPFALKYAPVTFLTFAGHFIVFMFAGNVLHLPWYLLLLLPPFTFALFATLFFALKKWCRPLLHLVAHYKLRAEDVSK